MPAEDLPPQVEAALVLIDATAAQPHETALHVLLMQFRNAITVAQQHEITQANLLARLRPGTRTLLSLAEATFGRTRPQIQNLASSPWNLNAYAIHSAFDETVLTSEDFLRNLCDYAASGASWEDAHKAIIEASKSRRAGTEKRPGVSLTRVFVPQDVRDAAAKTTPGGVTFRKKTRSQAKKKKEKKAAEQEAAKQERREEDAEEQDAAKQEGGEEEASPPRTDRRSPRPPSPVSTRKRARWPSTSPPRRCRTRSLSLEALRQQPDALHDEPIMFGGEEFSDDASTEFGEGDRVSASKNASVAGDGFDDGEVDFGDDGGLSSGGETPSGGESHDQLDQDHVSLSLFALRKRPPPHALPRPFETLTSESTAKTGMTTPRSSDLPKHHSSIPSALVSMKPTSPAHAAAKPSRTAADSVPPLSDGNPPRLSEDKLKDVAPTEPPKAEGIPGEEARLVSLALDQLSGLNWMGNTAIFKVLERLLPPHAVFLDIGDPLAAETRTWNDWARDRHYPTNGAADVFIPLHLRQQQHWVLLHISISEARVTFYDSMKQLNSYVDLHDAFKAITASLGQKWDSSWKMCNAVQALQQEERDFANCGVFVLIHCVYIAAKRQIPSQTDARLWRFLFSTVVRADNGSHGYFPLDSPPLSSESHPLPSERHLAALKLCQTLSAKLPLADEALQALSSVLSSAKSAEDMKSKEKERLESDLTHWHTVLEKASQTSSSVPDDDAAVQQLLHGFIDSTEAKKKILESELERYGSHKEAVRPAVVAVDTTCAVIRSRREEVLQVMTEAAQLMQKERADLRAALSKLETYMDAAGLL